MKTTNNPVWKKQNLLKMSWDTFEKYLTRIYAGIKKLQPAPDALVGIVRGGLPVLTAVSHALNIRSCLTINILRNRSDNKYSQRGEPCLEWGIPAELIRNKHILLVDDIAGNGGTLEYAIGYMQQCGASSVKTCVVVKNCGCGFPLDIYAVEVDDWVVFPWEVLDETHTRYAIKQLVAADDD